MPLNAPPSKSTTRVAYLTLTYPPLHRYWTPPAHAFEWDEMSARRGLDPDSGGVAGLAPSYQENWGPTLGDFWRTLTSVQAQPSLGLLDVLQLECLWDTGLAALLRLRQQRPAGKSACDDAEPGQTRQA